MVRISCICERAAYATKRDNARHLLTHELITKRASMVKLVHEIVGQFCGRRSSSGVRIPVSVVLIILAPVVERAKRCGQQKLGNMVTVMVLFHFALVLCVLCVCMLERVKSAINRKLRSVDCLRECSSSAR